MGERWLYGIGSEKGRDLRGVHESSLFNGGSTRLFLFYHDDWEWRAKSGCINLSMLLLYYEGFLVFFRALFFFFFSFSLASTVFLTSFYHPMMLVTLLHTYDVSNRYTSFFRSTSSDWRSSVK
jgi:hypothetical protein